MLAHSNRSYFATKKKKKKGENNAINLTLEEQTFSSSLSCH